MPVHVNQIIDLLALRAVFKNSFLITGILLYLIVTAILSQITHNIFLHGRADPGILKGGGAPIMKSDNEVRNGRVHRKGVVAGGVVSPSRAKRGRFLLLYVQNAI